ncbi:hypothetical protein LSH36_885g00061 [Paralvinella palmiformis]|uniref:Uncharacterized protein n=1 Tax=Paralvinella palmiformis TaxID=53620 RepID=A0AAD9IY55_9ANNE|nr:hypothetical protein LSH36_885g00061 [Paralvinella palmiformis]
MMLSVDAQRIKDVPNAGGSSVISEMLSLELLYRCFGASLLKSSGTTRLWSEVGWQAKGFHTTKSTFCTTLSSVGAFVAVQLWDDGSFTHRQLSDDHLMLNSAKTEMEVSYFPEGGSITDYVVSVFDSTIGVSVTRAFKYGGDYSEEDAVKLLNKKLNGILQSTQNTMDQWSKQILHVWTPSEYITDLIRKTFDSVISRTVKSNTVLLITTATNSRDIFFNRKRTKAIT